MRPHNKSMIRTVNPPQLSPVSFVGGSNVDFMSLFNRIDRNQSTTEKNFTCDKSNAPANTSKLGTPTNDETNIFCVALATDVRLIDTQ